MIAVTIHDLVARVREVGEPVRRTAIEAAHGEQVVARAIVTGQLVVTATEGIEYVTARESAA